MKRELRIASEISLVSSRESGGTFDQEFCALGIWSGKRFDFSNQKWNCAAQVAPVDACEDSAQDRYPPARCVDREPYSSLTWRNL